MTDHNDNIHANGAGDNGSDASSHANHDVELVASYASSAVDDVVDERMVVEWLATCSACQSEFDLQNGISSLLARTTTVEMTDEERRQLHSDVTAALARADVGATVTDLASRRQRRWMLTASVAAVSLAAVIGVGSLLSGGMGGDTALVTADAGTTEIEAPLAPVEMRELDEEASAVAEAASADDGMASQGAGQADSATEETAAAEAAASPDVSADEAGQFHEDLADDQSRESLRAYLEERVDAVASRQPLTAIPPGAFSDTESPTPPCLTDEIGDFYLVIESTLEGSPVVAVIVGPSADELDFVVFDAATCEVLDLGS